MTAPSSPITREEMLEAFTRLNVWKRRDERAPHKPLLILHALGRWQQHRSRTFSFAEVEAPLRELLVEFGPPRKSAHPAYPFWRLQRDGLWIVRGADQAVRRGDRTDPRVTELRRLGATASFPEEFYEAFERDPGLVYDLAEQLLEAHFPASMHADILEAVGIRQEYRYREQVRRVRDPRFRYQVLVAYEARCAVCGLSVRLGNALLGIEAAHIKWHQAGGPDAPVNGLALCVLHHKLFDRGAYTLSFDRSVQVSELVDGSEGAAEWLLRYQGRRLRDPVSPRYVPGDEYIAWHNHEVFRGPARGR